MGTEDGSKSRRDGERAGEGDAAVDVLRSHLVELPGRDRDRVALIAAETTRAFERLAHVRKAVSVFGSARREPADRWGEAGRRLADELARGGFAVITGGGPGLMASANEGARGHGVLSIGLTIDLPLQEEANPYLELEVPFHYFFLRKLAFIKYSCAFICLPGGFGTLDEMFEALNLVCTHKLHPFPVILFDSDFWGGLVEWLETAAVGAGTLTEERLRLLEVLDEPAQVVERVRECHETLCRTLGIDLSSSGG